MEFTVTIADAAHLAGITAARDAYNAALPDETVTGYIEIKDAAGNTRKLAVVS
jgi:hypothetical protein